MDVFQAVTERRSIRKFQKKEIPDEMVDRLIESLIWAPSAGNLQARKFYLVSDPSVKEALAKAALGQAFIKEAPLVIVGCTDGDIAGRYGSRGVELYTVQDVACSIMGMMLVAHEMGLGTVWVGAFYEEQAAHVLDLQDRYRPVVIVPVGWPERIPTAPHRVKTEEAVIMIRG